VILYIGYNFIFFLLDLPIASTRRLMICFHETPVKKKSAMRSVKSMNEAECGVREYSEYNCPKWRHAGREQGLRAAGVINPGEDAMGEIIGRGLDLCS